MDQPPDRERIVTLETRFDGIDAKLAKMDERQEKMADDIGALREKFTGASGKIQGAVAVVGLLGLGGVLHWLGAMLSPGHGGQ